MSDRRDPSYAAALGRLSDAASRAATDRVEEHIPPLVELLADAGVHAIVLKGPTTRRRFYGVDELRPVADVDLLVRSGRFRRATKVLGEVGFRRVERHGHSDTLQRGEGGVDVDLHLTLPYVRASPSRAFAVLDSHRVDLEVAGRSVPVLDPPAHAVHLAIHAAVNLYAAQSRALDEWRRGYEALDSRQRRAAEEVVAELGVCPVWDVAVRSLTATSPQDLVRELPLWELEPRVGALRDAWRSGVPIAVRARDVERMVALQLGDDALNKWRADRGLGPFDSNEGSITMAKVGRLASVSLAGARRMMPSRGMHTC